MPANSSSSQQSDRARSRPEEEGCGGRTPKVKPAGVGRSVGLLNWKGNYGVQNGAAVLVGFCSIFR